MNNKNVSILIRIAELLSAILLILMTIVCFANVCSRHVFHESIAASEEITTNLFVIVSLIGAALAARGRNHIGFNLFTDKFSPRGKLFHGIFEGVVGCGFMGFLSYYAFKRVEQLLITGQISTGLSVPMWIYGLLALIGFVIVFAVFAEIGISAEVKLIKHDYEEQREEQNN